MQEQNLSNTHPPVEENHLEIADTFQDAGTRPIEASPGFLVSTLEDTDNRNKQSITQKNSSQSEINTVPPLD